MRLKTQSGFTVIELMIATVVFSLTLMIMAAGFVQIGRIYYKGITTARTQEIARNTLDEVSRHLQFSVGNVICIDGAGNSCDSGDSNGTVCIGGNHFLFNINQTVSATTPALRRAPPAPSNTPCGSITTGTELLASNMRLIDFQVNCLPSPDICDISVVIATGDDHLLDSPGDRSTFCLGGQVGAQFCAVTSLKTAVARRVN